MSEQVSRHIYVQVKKRRFAIEWPTECHVKAWQFYQACTYAETILDIVNCESCSFRAQRLCTHHARFLRFKELRHG